MLYLEEKPWELGGKERCGLTSKLVSRTTDDCHPWHSNLCHGQMTTFILSVDRHVILERFREEAPLCQKDGISFFSVMFYLTLPTGVEWSYLSLAIIWNNLPLIQTTPGFFFYLKLPLWLFVSETRYPLLDENEKEDALNWTNKHDRFFYGSEESHAA